MSSVSSSSSSLSFSCFGNRNNSSHNNVSRYQNIILADQKLNEYNSNRNCFLCLEGVVQQQQQQQQQIQHHRQQKRQKHHTNTAGSTPTNGNENNRLESTNNSSGNRNNSTRSSSEDSTTSSNNSSSSSSSSSNSHNSTKSNPYTDTDVNDDMFPSAAKELNALSFQERERLLEEIHGVADIPQETPELVQNCLEQFQEALQLLPTRRRIALEKALFLKPSLEYDTKFLLLFLRADHYDARKAARRFAKYFEDKLELFGTEKLVKRITLEDLSDDDKALLHVGAQLLLPYKDRSGRPITFVNVPKLDYTQWKVMARCSWYLIMTTVLDDEDAQFKGVSAIQYCMGNWNGSGVSFSSFHATMSKCGDIIRNLPARVTTVHFCFNDGMMKHVLNTFQQVFGRDLRLRVRAHFGTDLEVQYSLMTYGIHCPLLDITNPERNQVLLSNFLKRRQEQEQQWASNNANHSTTTTTTTILSNDKSNNNNNKATTNTIVLYPNKYDILVGRGSPYQNYPGNQFLGELIESKYLQQFQNTQGRLEKTKIYLNVIEHIAKEYGGRFLERSSTTTTTTTTTIATTNNNNNVMSNQNVAPVLGWKIVAEAVARKKVCSAFRSAMVKVGTTTKTTNITGHIQLSSSNKRSRSDDSNNTSTTTTTTTNESPTSRVPAKKTWRMKQ